MIQIGEELAGTFKVGVGMLSAQTYEAYYEVNVYDDPEIIAALNIYGFPTIVVFNDGMFQGAFSSKISKEAVITWAKEIVTKQKDGL